MLESFAFDWQLAGTNLLRLLIAFALAFPIAWDRIKSERSFGLRTFPIVSVASCGYVLIALSVVAGNPDALIRHSADCSAGWA